MSHTVSKKFKTVNRCFEVGDPVSAPDIEGALSFDEWVAAGFIKSDDDSEAPPMAQAAASSSGVSNQD